MFFDENSEDAVNKSLTEINMIPLIDVMLVLLILFIITAPLLVPHYLQVEVPQVAPTQRLSTFSPVELTINKDGELFWQGTPIDQAKLVTHLQELKQQPTPPTVQLQADKMLPYQNVMAILAIIQNAGVTDIALITEPLEH